MEVLWDQLWRRFIRDKLATTQNEMLGHFLCVNDDPSGCDLYPVASQPSKKTGFPSTIELRLHFWFEDQDVIAEI